MYMYIQMLCVSNILGSESVLVQIEVYDQPVNVKSIRSVMIRLSSATVELGIALATGTWCHLPYSICKIQKPRFYT